MLKSTAEISEIVENTVRGLGFEFVEFERLQAGMMRITIDSMDKPGDIGVNDCEMVSDQITHLFTVEGIEYERLEVTSPGVDRPLKRLCDFARFTGALAHVELFEPLHAEGFPEAGRRKLDGHIVAVEGDGADAMIRFSFESVHVPRTPSEAALARKNKTQKKNTSAQPVIVEFPFGDVDRANLIAQLDFRGKQK